MYLELIQKITERKIEKRNKKKDIEVEVNIVKQRGKTTEYFNIPCSFDIETSSFRYEGKKCALMYCWMMNIWGVTFFGRTWDEWLELLDKLQKDLMLGEDRRLVIYVHNLSFEFQFIKSFFNWIDVFSLDKLKPIRAISSEGFEFRCSYLLSGYSLKKLASELTEHKIEKMVGDLDYNLIRHSDTPLTQKELGYCENDVVIVTDYIEERIKTDGNIMTIPLTKTGYVRKYCREQCLSSNYANIMSRLVLTTDEYALLKQAFQGGFTHANSFYSRKLMKDVSSFDFTSSYPTVMICDKFPMSAGIHISNIESDREFNYYLDKYCCLIKIKLNNVVEDFIYEHIISVSKCLDVQGKIKEDNGRLVSCDGSITLVITETDYKLYKEFYKWDSEEVLDLWIYEKQYLPKEFVCSILKLYEDKTKLKGIPEEIIAYSVAKGMLNACYGMTVTDICRDTITFIEEWGKEPVNTLEAIAKYNQSKNRFLFYPWGIWITSYARRNLFSAILEYKEDYIYSDTDSVKVLNRENHMDYIIAYNNEVINKLEKAMEYHGLDKELIRPKNIKQVQKPLGIWDYEGTYQKFKTLGAKRYMTLKDNEISITVSGLNKEITIPYLLSLVNQDYNKIEDGDSVRYEITGIDRTDELFNTFDLNLYVPSQYTGKLIHDYIDEEIDGYVTDYLGETIMFHHTSSVHLDGCDYNLNLSQKYIDWLLEVQEDVS